MAARKSRMYLNSFLPVNHTHDEMVKQIFLPGKFGCTVTGNLQMLGIICLCANLSLVLATDYCHFHPCNRKLDIGSSIANIFTTTALYFIFSCGYAVENPALWVRINIVLNLTLSTITISAQAISMKVCITKTSAQKSPGPIALAGGICLLISCVTLFILYKYKEIEDSINLGVIVHQRKASEDQSFQQQENGNIGDNHARNHNRKMSVYSIHDDGHLRTPKLSTETQLSAAQFTTHVPHRKRFIYLKHDEIQHRRKSLPHMHLLHLSHHPHHHHHQPYHHHNHCLHHQHHHHQCHRNNKVRFSQDDSSITYDPHYYNPRHKISHYAKYT